MLEKTFRTMIEDISVFYIFQSLCYRNGPLILNHVLKGILWEITADHENFTGNHG